MGFKYYSFVLNGEERIYYTTETNEGPEEILEWAERFSFIKESDIPNCKNARRLSEEEVAARNRELYKKWWQENKKKGSLSGKTPPTIGEVQLN